ncbi:hypothetical protein Q1695_009606 [Nippostrongylus brasiliensis]|nr:hypothetical protein Q1695_009606 [Nippostrongylus brasiliensis]
MDGFTASPRRAPAVGSHFGLAFKSSRASCLYANISGCSPTPADLLHSATHRTTQAPVTRRRARTDQLTTGGLAWRAREVPITPQGERRST